MRIVELFSSKQGEGLWTGTESVFVRTLGCPLACRFCDTPYASDESREGEELGAEEIFNRIRSFGPNDVVLTGGEPLLHREIVPLCEMLHTKGFRITIETAGIRDTTAPCDLMSISPKLSNSRPLDDEPAARIRRHENNRERPDIVRSLIGRYAYQLKFVVDTPVDFAEIEAYLLQFPGIEPSRVLLMPQGIDRDALREKAVWLVPYCEAKGYRYCPRMQIEWFGNRRGT